MLKKKKQEIIISDRYITSLPLLEGEETIFQVKYSLFVLTAKIIGLVILDAVITYLFIEFDIARQLGLEKYEMWVNLSPTIIIGFVALVIFLDWLTIKYTLTNKRVELTRGILGTFSQSIAVDRIHSVFLQRSLLGRIFNYGTIVIKSAATDFKIGFANISSPAERQEQIEEQIGKIT